MPSRDPSPPRSEPSRRGEPAEARAEQLAERALGTDTPKRRMLVIVNPYATTVSERLRHLVVYALQGRYDAVAVETEARDHATELCREAAAEGYDVVAAFGGDGTINEAANGLVGSDTALAVLPGGSTNVFSRSLGVPNDVVDATEHLLGLADAFEPRRIDTGRVNGRHFLFSSGAGIDAAVVRRVEGHPWRKANMREWYFAWAAVSTHVASLVRRSPRIVLEADGRRLEGMTVVAQNSDPYSYFGELPIRVGQEADLASGSLSLVVLTRTSALDFPTLVPRLLSGRSAAVTGHRNVHGLSAVGGGVVRAASGDPFPLHVDGDYLGECREARYEAIPRSLLVVA